MDSTLFDTAAEVGRRKLLGLAAGVTLLAGRAWGEPRKAVFKAETPEPTGPQDYTLPLLPYAKDALGGFLSAEILELHHDKHHAGYVKGLNKAIADLSEARQSGNLGSIQELERDVAFHGSGHVLHSLYWESMSPKGGGRPRGALNRLMTQSFGSFDGFRAQFSAAARAAEASGWALLSYEPLGGRLIVSASESHQNMAFQGAVPLLACDVWEHAYYLQYHNDRARYVDGFFDVIDWSGAEARLKARLSKAPDRRPAS